MCLLKVEHVQKYYGNGGNITKALNDISFDMKEGEFVAITSINRRNLVINIYIL